MDLTSAAPSGLNPCRHAAPFQWSCPNAGFLKHSLEPFSFSATQFPSLDLLRSVQWSFMLQSIVGGQQGPQAGSERTELADSTTSPSLSILPLLNRMCMNLREGFLDLSSDFFAWLLCRRMLNGVAMDAQATMYRRALRKPKGTK